MKIDVKIPTSGDGYYSSKRKPVRLTKLELIKYDGDNYGELRVHFDTRSWNVDRDGLIYSDKLFIHELKHFLVGKLGLPSAVSYSEQGMQGDNYVSLDAGPNFIESFKKLGV